jgi:hypothetical protein
VGRGAAGRVRRVMCALFEVLDEEVRHMAQALTFHDLKDKTVAELREIAKTLDHEAVRGYTQLNKDHLLKALCEALNIQMHEHHDVVGLDKTTVKAQIRELKKKRDEAMAAHDAAQLHMIRRRIHRLKRDIHKSTV